MRAYESRQSRKRTAIEVFVWPTVIAAVSLFGLIAALVGHGGYDVLGALALLVPVAAGIWAWMTRRR